MKMLVENSVKKVQKLFKKSIDITIFLRYYRGSFWIKKLFRRLKQKFSQNNSTLYNKTGFPRSYRSYSIAWGFNLNFMSILRARIF